MLSPLPTGLPSAAVEEIYRQGFVALGAEHFRLAAACFEEVRARQPQNPYVRHDLARVYFQLLERERAETILAEAERAAGDDGEFWYEIGRAYQEGRIDDAAERCYLAARSCAPENPVLAAAVVAYYESRGQLALAQAALEQVNGSCGGLTTALTGMVRLRSGDFAAAQQSLRASLAELSENHPYQINVRYALARAEAATGKEAASLETLRAAKARQLTLPETQRQLQVSELNVKFRTAARVALPANDFRAAWRAEVASSERPLVFLLGYPRSGTTLLEQILEAHSAVRGFEETGAFLRALGQLFESGGGDGRTLWEVIDAPEAAGRDSVRASYFESLRRLGAPSDAGVVLLDKNPGLTGHIQLISRLFPHAKFLFVARDLRDICVSAYQTQVTLTPFSANWLRWPDTVEHCVQTYEHWLGLRDRLPNPYLEVRYEDLVNNVPQTVGRVMEFLGLAWETQQEEFVAHARAKRLYSPTQYDVRQGVHAQAIGKWRHFGLDYSAVEPRLAAVLSQFGYDVDSAAGPSPAAACAGKRPALINETAISERRAFVPTPSTIS